jgi:hypothetical protein
MKGYFRYTCPVTGLSTGTTVRIPLYYMKADGQEVVEKGMEEGCWCPACGNLHDFGWVFKIGVCKTRSGYTDGKVWTGQGSGSYQKHLAKTWGVNPVWDPKEGCWVSPK